MAALAEPKSGGRTVSHRTAVGIDFFPSGTATVDHVLQGGRTDCWLLAGLAAVAKNHPTVLTSRLREAGGNVFVKLFNHFTSTEVEYEMTRTFVSPPKAGDPRGLWVWAFKKAFAHHRSGFLGMSPDYMALSWGGWPTEVFQALGATDTATRMFWPSTASAAGTLITDIQTLATGGKSVAVGVIASASGVPLSAQHSYSLHSTTGSSRLSLRNPIRGHLVGITAAQLAKVSGAVCSGTPLAPP